MANNDRLSQLKELFEHLQVRKLYTRTREWLKERDIKPAPGWAKIQKAFEDRRGEKDFAQLVDDFESFVREAVLVSYKRVYVLSEPIPEAFKLMPKLAEGIRRDYLSADVPKREQKDTSFALETRQVGKAKVTTFITTRPVRQNQEIDESNLSEDARKRYSGAKIVARYEIDLRCYDHVVEVGGQTMLLIDAPDGVDGPTLQRDEENYIAAICTQQEEPATASVFVDLFPAIAALWKDDSEGIVNSLEFVSNHRAQIRGKFAISSNENYRNQPFQVAGQKDKEVQVECYRIAVKWPNRAGEPIVVLPGKAHMAIAVTADTPGKRQALLRMEFPQYTAWDNFLFALERVRAHLPAPVDEEEDEALER